MAKKALPSGYRYRDDSSIERRFTVEGKRYSVYGNTVNECQEKELDLRDQIRNGLYVSNRNITLNAYYKEWKVSREGTVKGSTEYNIDIRYRKHIAPVFGKKKVTLIERREITKFQKVLKKNLKASTVNIIVTDLKKILSDAVMDGIISKSPAVGIKDLKAEDKPASETIHRALTVYEQEQFMKYAKDEWLYELLAFLLCTGMRFGEAASLTWKNIDHVNNVIHVTSTVTLDNKGNRTVGTPKSKSSDRDVPMNDSIKSILRSQKAKQSLLYGNVIDMSQRVFIGAKEGIVSNKSTNNAIGNVLLTLGSEGIEIEPFTVHALRDTFATRYIEQGGNPQTLKTILGHSSLSMTMDLYSHVLPNTKQEEMNNIKIAF